MQENFWADFSFSDDRRGLAPILLPSPRLMLCSVHRILTPEEIMLKSWRVCKLGVLVKGEAQKNPHFFCDSMGLLIFSGALVL